VPADPAVTVKLDTPCSYCGYNLRGLEKDGRCPECGVAIAQSIRGDLLRITGADSPCARCGYNLRGLARDGRCPECGFAIEQSIRGDLLRFADTDWLTRLKFGTTLKLWNILVGIVVVFIAFVIVFAGMSQVFLLLPAVVAGGLGLWAVFLITAPEPRLAQREDPVSLRKVVRLCAVLAFSGELVKHAGESAGGNTGVAMKIIGTVLTVAGVVQAFGELVYFRRFARRIPEPQLERSTTIVLWGLPAALGACLIGGLIAVLAGGPAPGTPGSAAQSVALVIGLPALCLGGLALLVFGLWYIGLLVSYRREFQAAIDASREELVINNY
jgi:hypothetical protein